MGLVQLALLVAALGQAGSVIATPPQLVAASDKPVELSLQLDSASPQTTVRFDTFGTGSVSATQRTAGRFTAQLTPPKERYPQLLIVRAEVTDGAARRNVWAAIPVFGVQTVKITTKPNAEVDVVVGAAHFPAQVKADAQGRVDVAILVPPGVDVARVRSVDRLGNKTDKPLPLDPPEFVRVRAAPVGRDAEASWADTAPLPLEIYGVQRDGSALPASANVLLEVDGKEGTVDAPKGVRPGLWTTQYRAPPKTEDGKAVLRARLKERSGTGRPSTLELSLKPGPVSRLSLVADKVELHMDDASALITADAFDANDNRIGPAEKVTTDYGAVSRKGEQFVLTAPSHFADRDTLTLTATAGGLSATLPLPLRTGKAALGELAFEKQTLRAADDPLPGTLRLWDARGNPVLGAQLLFSSGTGVGELTREAGGGVYEIRYVATASAEAGPTTLNIQVVDSEVKLQQALTVLPYIKPGSTSVGLFAGVRSNIGLLRGASTTLELAAHPVRRPLELLANVTYATFAPATQPVSGIDVVAKLSTIQLLFGGRYSFSLGPVSDVYVMSALGLQRVQQDFQLAHVSELQLSAPGGGLILRVGGGYTRKLWRGRIAFELGYGFESFTFKPARESGFPTITGNLGGVQLGVGYLFQLF